MRILLSILLLFSFAAKAQDTTKYMQMSAKGYKFNGATFKNIWIGQDTTNYKTGIARIGSRFFVGNGILWTEIAGGSGTGANIYNSSGQITGSRIVDLNGNTLTFTNSAAPADMLFDNGTQFIEMSTTHDWVNIFNGHTSLKVIDGINVNMVNTGTASMRTDSIPVSVQRIYQFPNRAGTLALTSDTAGLRSLIEGKVDSVTFTSSTCVDTINVYRAGVKTQKTIDKVNGLLSGGEVTPGANDTTFNVGVAVYNAQCVRYTSAATTITLNGNSDSAKGRIDVIYTSAGNVGAIQGQNLTNPIAPALTASQIGLATVYFPPLSDSGITNIYNVTNVNGIDSNAIHTVAVTSDSSAFIFTSLRRVDTIYTSRSTAIDSLRRLAGSVNVQARKGGVWVTQFTDSVGSGGGGSVNPYYLPYSSFDPFVKLHAGVIKGTATASPNTPIVWAFLDTTSNGVHDKIGFDSVNGNGNIIQVYYPPVEHIVSFVVTPDESLATTGVQVGASVGVDGKALISAYRLTMNAGKLTGNTTAWTASGLSLSVNSYSTSTGLTSITPAGNAGNFLGASNEIEGTQISYVGDQHYRIRRKYSGLGGLIGFYLVDSTNKIVTGNLQSTDIVTVMFGRPVTTPIPAQTVNSVLYPSDIYTAGSNYWITAVFRLWFRACPENSTTNKMIWRNYKIGSNYATSYRITRAALSTPGTETTIYTGSAFACTDASASTGVQYIYRMYATVLGVESLVTNEKCITQ